MTVDPSKVQGTFTSIAEKYDRLNTILTLNIDQLWRKKAVSLCGIKKNDRVLDLCCGTGKMVGLLCKSVGVDQAVIGLDFNREMLAVGERQLQKQSNNLKYELIQGDATALPFEADSFDCVTIAFGLRNIPDKGKAISEMLRVLKPGGKVVCLELSKPELPIFKNIYDLYFINILPLVGYLGTQDKAAYQYLRDSVNGFLKKDQLMVEFEKAGFEQVGFKSLSLGIAAIHYGVKRG